jgi:hypothetical protein
MRFVNVLGPEATAMIIAGLVTLLGFATANVSGVADGNPAERQSVRLIFEP